MNALAAFGFWILLGVGSISIAARNAPTDPRAGYRTGNFFVFLVGFASLLAAFLAQIGNENRNSSRLDDGEPRSRCPQQLHFALSKVAFDVVFELGIEGE